MNQFYIFGDSHCRCFTSLCKNIMCMPASSAKGLINKNSKTKSYQRIHEKILTLQPISNLLFFFGKVDMDFILNYKWNTEPLFKNYEEYIKKIVLDYILFIKNYSTKHNIFLCELPITHYPFIRF